MKLMAVCSMVLVLLCGCASAPLPKPVPFTVGRPAGEHRVVKVYLDENLSNDRKTITRVAVAEWNMALNGHMHLELIPFVPMSTSDLRTAESEDDILILGVDHSDPIFQKGAGQVANADCHDGCAIATTLPFGKKLPGALIYLATDRNQNMTTIMHELGHALGADDREESDLLMSGRNAHAEHVDRDAVEQVSKAFYWDPNTLVYR